MVSPILDHENISPTAKLVAYLRQFTDIPFSKDVAELFDTNSVMSDVFGALQSQHSQVFTMAPHLELRYKSIRDWILSSPFTQILEFASGISLRGLAMTESPKFTYVETDLPGITDEKIKLVNVIMDKYGIEKRTNLFFCKANVLNYAEIEPALDHFDVRKPIVIVHEGLFQYLNKDEKTLAAKHIHRILNRFGGAWITPDLDTIDQSHGFDTLLYQYASFINAIEKVTGRDFKKNSFAHDEDTITFFNKLGFKVDWVLQFHEGTSLSSLPNDSLLFTQVIKRLRLWVITISN